MMQHVADGFTAIAVLTGFIAAWLWLRASRIQIEPDREALARVRGNANVALIHARAAREAWERSGLLNNRAATWTAVSVAAQAIATVLGRFAGPG